MDDHISLLTRAFRVRILVEVLKNTNGVRGVAVSARLAVNQKVTVRLRSDTLEGLGMVAKILQQSTLVLNRNWQPVNVATVARALVLLWNESARVVDPADYRLYTWADWSQLRAGEGERFIQAVRLRLRMPEVIVLADYDRLPSGCCQLQPPQRIQAGSLVLPILRLPARQRGIDDRPRRSAVAGWHVDLGKLCVGVHRLQQAQGRSHAAPGRHAAPQGAGAADLEADLRPRQRADRKLVEVYQRDVLERPAGEVICPAGRCHTRCRASGDT